MLQTECTLFFEENPYALETVEGLAERLGRKAEHLRPVLEHLVSLSILSQVGNQDRVLYRYSRPDSMAIG